ncbi:uncharacterized protein IL334_001538 [Kwoniella shivajii]|uniref:Amidase domain-containing protein n=1 Tax=Kwoniella shivajii TaxID=564305 RepID=A0ABZ1CSK0_9TREE|nr:hypothetical protein IL334_001538 [Kwoniella shivajii]
MGISSNYLTATETIALVAQGQLTVEQLALDHLSRYDERDPVVHAWAYVDRERILREAKRLDGIPKEQRGPLHGVVLGVKDMMNMPTQSGSPIYKDSRPNVDAGCVAICRAAGALIFGKTHTTEFACSNVGPPGCSNPYDAERTPGGSSSGSAAAVRDFQCSLALGTQTGGSIIRPASYNGVFAIKPTWNAISTYGLKPYATTLDTVGFFARSIEDLQLLSKVFNINSDIPLSPTIKPLASSKFAFVKTDQWINPTPELQSAWERSASLLREAGAEVIDLELPSEFIGISRGSAWTINQAEGRISFQYEWLNHPDLLGDLVKSHLDSRNTVTQKQLVEAYDKVSSLRPIIDKIASQYDAIITPSVESEATIGLGFTGSPRYNAMWTALHVPCVNIPGFASENGMPIGLTLLGPRFNDERLLQVADTVAKVWVGVDQAKLNLIPAPEGALQCKV